MDIASIIIELLVGIPITAAALFVVSRLPLGIEIISFGELIKAASIYRFLCIFLYPAGPLVQKFVPFLLFFPILLLINIVLFLLTSVIVGGFRIRNITSASLGAVLLTIFMNIIARVLS